MSAADLINLEAERKTLGVYLNDDNALLISDLKVHEFNDLNRVAYDAMRVLAEGTEAVNPITVLAEAKRRGGKAAQRLEVGYLKDLLSGVDFVDVADLTSYERAVRNSANRRALLQDLQDASKAVLDDSQDVDEIRGRVQQALMTRSQDGDKTFLAGGAAASDAGLAYLEKIFAANGGLLGAATGLRRYDNLIGGLQPGQLSVFGAATGGGKTTLALQIARNVLEQGKAVYYASLEMALNQCMMKMAGAKARVNDHEFKKSPSEADHRRLAQALAALRPLPFYCDDRAGATLAQIRTSATQAHSHHKNGGLSLIVVDYLQLMTGDGRRGESRAVEVGRFANGLKALARDLEVPVIALAQINRATHGRADKRPLLSDLRESGDIENAADVVALLYREGYYDPNIGEVDKTELIVRKNRFGPQGTINLTANLAVSSFVEEAQHE